MLTKQAEQGVFPGFSILLFDDDREWVGITKEYLHNMGIKSVDSAHTGEEATRKIKEHRYDAVLADIAIRPAREYRSPSLQGDDWLMEHTEQLKGSMKAVVTAHPGQIKDRKSLSEHNVIVVTKSRPEEKQLYLDLKKLAEGKMESMSDRGGEESEAISPAITDETTTRENLTPESGGDTTRGVTKAQVEEFMLGQTIALQAAEVFQEWVQTRANPEGSSTWFGSQKYSLQQIAEEVRTGTPLGQRILGMFIRHIRIVSGLQKSPFND